MVVKPYVQTPTGTQLMELNTPVMTVVQTTEGQIVVATAEIFPEGFNFRDSDPDTLAVIFPPGWRYEVNNNEVTIYKPDGHVLISFERRDTPLMPCHAD